MCSSEQAGRGHELGEGGWQWLLTGKASSSERIAGEKKGV